MMSAQHISIPLFTIVICISSLLYTSCYSSNAFFAYPKLRSTLPIPNKYKQCFPLSSSICHGIDYSFLSTKNELYNFKKEDILNKHQIEYITELVRKRSEARNNCDYELADSIREEINTLSDYETTITNEKKDKDKQQKLLIPRDYIVEIKDIPRKEGGGSIWTLKKQKPPIEWDNNLESSDVDYEFDTLYDDSSVLKIAHSALGLASWSSENNVSIDKEKLENLVLQAKHRLLKTNMSELRGRKASDAAFWFAMAGVNDEIHEDQCDRLKFKLFDALTFICLEELRRFGKRSSCHSTDILHIVERIAAAAIKSDFTILLQQKAAECLLVKDYKSNNLFERGIIDQLNKGDYELHSERSLLWIWRFSTRQRKQQAFLKSASLHWQENLTKVNYRTNEMSNQDDIQTIFEWDKCFDNARLPLVVDLGCGMGISILGLASTSPNDQMGRVKKSMIDIDWSQCNYIGVDLSQLAINFASSVSYRWQLQGRVHFAVSSAEEAITNIIASYPGPVQLITIQFPTPFSFQQDKYIEEHGEVLTSVVNQGNKQLPSSAFSGFMVTKHLLELANAALKDDSGKLLLQSNVEDVAVFMKNIAINQTGFRIVDIDSFVDKLDTKTDATKRTLKYIAKGGERAEGPCWSSVQLLPRKGATETEVACSLNGTPIHRCLLRPD